MFAFSLQSKSSCFTFFFSFFFCCYDRTACLYIFHNCPQFLHQLAFWLPVTEIQVALLLARSHQESISLKLIVFFFFFTATVGSCLFFLFFFVLAHALILLSITDRSTSTVSDHATCHRVTCQSHTVSLVVLQITHQPRQLPLLLKNDLCYFYEVLLFFFFSRRFDLSVRFCLAHTNIQVSSYRPTTRTSFPPSTFQF